MSFMNAVRGGKKYYDLTHGINQVVIAIEEKVEAIEHKIDTVVYHVQEVTQENVQQIIRVDNLYDSFELLQGMVNYTCPIRHD